MRKLLALSAATALTLGVAMQATAAPLDFVGTLAVQISTLAPIPLTGAGTADVTAGTIKIPGGVFSGQVPVPITDPAAAPINGLFVDASNLSGTFGQAMALPPGASGQTGNRKGGLMGVNGVSVVCLFSFTGTIPCPVAGLSVPFAAGANTGLGLGGPPIAVFNTVVNIGVTVQGFPWEGAGSFGVSNSIAANFPTPISDSSVVQLVSPLLINTTIPASSFLPGFGILTMHFAPEPGSMVLLVTGVAGFILAGRRRARRR
jgi:hypothetical protein